MIDKNNFKQRLIYLRNECGLSQNRLASMLSVSAQAVSKWETGISLPDIDLLPSLAQALGVTVDHLLGAKTAAAENDSEIVCENLLGYDISDDNSKILAAMSAKLTRKQLYQCARLVETEKLSFKLVLEAHHCDHDVQNVLTKALDLNSIPLTSLAGVATPLADLTIRVVNKSSDPIKEIVQIFHCPACGGDLAYYKDDGGKYLSCGEHRYPFIEGVIDFGTFEQHGNTWSSWIRSYGDFKKKLEQFSSADITLREKYGNLTERLVENICERKPSVILDIGSGMATFVESIMKRLDWPCTIILTDVSHRVLKYDKRRFDERAQNPNVNLVYLACDARHLPIKDGSLQMVVSFGGFENIAGDITASIAESHRVLTKNGSLVTSMCVVLDKAAASTKRWMHLIEIDPDPDMPSYLDKILDLNLWSQQIETVGFQQHSITVMSNEAQPPDGDKFPYNYEISRWMADSVIAAMK